MIKNHLGLVLKKWVAFFLLISFILLNVFINPNNSYAQHPLEGITTGSRTAFVSPFKLLSSLSLPKELGTIEDKFIPKDAKSDQLIIYLQDAHTNYDSENSVRRLIHLFQKEHHLPLVLLEGGEGKLDSLFFRSFPDGKVKEKILNDYVSKGELSGGEIASILNDDYDTDYYGIETQALYNENKAAFIKAVAREKEINDVLNQIESNLTQKIETSFSSRIKTFHEKQKAFREESIDLTEYLKVLSSLRSDTNRHCEGTQCPKQSQSTGLLRPHLDRSLAMTVKDFSFNIQFPELHKILTAESNEQRFKGEDFDAAMTQLIRLFQQKVLLKLPKAKQSEINHMIQLYRIGQMNQGMLMDRMEQMSREMNFNLRAPKVLKPTAQHARMMSSIKGTKVFNELETLEKELIQTLPQSDDERQLLEDFWNLNLLKSFSKLELRDKDWQELKAKKPSDLLLSVIAKRHEPSLRGHVVPEAISEHGIASATPLNPTDSRTEQSRNRSGFGAALPGFLPRNDNDLDSLFASHFRFYQLAEERDKALFNNMLRVMKEKKTKFSMIVTGGFHSEGITKKLRESNIPFVLIAPKIDHISDSSQYMNIMQGKISYMKYFKGSLWDALAQDYSAKLVASLKEEDLTPSLKRWRDRIIQNSIAEGRITQATSYTKYVDALVQALRKEYEKGSPINQLTEDEIKRKLSKELDAFISVYFEKIQNLMKQKFSVFSNGLEEMWKTGDITPKSVGDLINRVNTVKTSNLAVALALIRLDKFGMSLRGADDPNIIRAFVERAIKPVLGKVDFSPDEIKTIWEMAREFKNDPEFISAAKAEVRATGIVNPAIARLSARGIPPNRALFILQAVTDQIENEVPRSEARMKIKTTEELNLQEKDERKKRMESYFENGEWKEIAGPLIAGFVNRGSFKGTSYDSKEDVLSHLELRLQEGLRNDILEKYNGDAAPKTYLFRVFTNALKVLYRSQKRRRFNQEPKFGMKDRPDLGESPFQAVERRELSGAVRDVLITTSERNRELLRSLYIEGKSYQQIAKEQRIPLGTVKSRLNAAREDFQDEFKKMYPSLIPNDALAAGRAEARVISVNKQQIIDAFNKVDVKVTRETKFEAKLTWISGSQRRYRINVLDSDGRIRNVRVALDGDKVTKVEAYDDNAPKFSLDRLREVLAQLGGLAKIYSKYAKVVPPLSVIFRVKILSQAPNIQVVRITAEGYGEVTVAVRIGDGKDNILHQAVAQFASDFDPTPKEIDHFQWGKPEPKNRVGVYAKKRGPPIKPSPLPKKPAMPAPPIEQIIEDFLAYQDAPFPPDISMDFKTEILKKTLDPKETPRAREYAQILRQLIEKFGDAKLNLTIERYQFPQKLRSILGKLGITASPFGQSRTWYYWDIAKQFYYLKLGKADEGYMLGNPLEDETKRREILRRHVGWEVYGYYHYQENQADKVPPKLNKTYPSYQKILDLINKPPKLKEQTLGSKDLAELGALIEQNLAWPKSPQSPAARSEARHILKVMQQYSQEIQGVLDKLDRNETVTELEIERAHIKERALSWAQKKGLFNGREILKRASGKLYPAYKKISPSLHEWINKNHSVDLANWLKADLDGKVPREIARERALRYLEASGLQPFAPENLADFDVVEDTDLEIGDFDPFDSPWEPSISQGAVITHVNRLLGSMFTEKGTINRISDWSISEKLREDLFQSNPWLSELVTPIEELKLREIFHAVIKDLGAQGLGSYAIQDILSETINDQKEALQILEGLSPEAAARAFEEILTRNLPLKYRSETRQKPEKDKIEFPKEDEEFFKKKPFPKTEKPLPEIWEYLPQPNWLPTWLGSLWSLLSKIVFELTFKLTVAFWRLIDRERVDQIMQESNQRKINMFLGNEVAVRSQSINEIANQDQAPNVDLILLALSDENGWVRETAARALGKLGDPSAVADLIKLSTTDSNENVQKATIEALAEIRNRARAELRATKSDQDPEPLISGTLSPKIEFGDNTIVTIARSEARSIDDEHFNALRKLGEDLAKGTDHSTPELENSEFKFILDALRDSEVTPENFMNMLRRAKLEGRDDIEQLLIDSNLPEFIEKTNNFLDVLDEIYTARAEMRMQIPQNLKADLREAMLQSSDFRLPMKAEWFLDLVGKPEVAQRIAEIMSQHLEGDYFSESFQWDVERAIKKEFPDVKISVDQRFAILYRGRVLYHLNKDLKFYRETIRSPESILQKFERDAGSNEPAAILLFDDDILIPALENSIKRTLGPTGSDRPYTLISSIPFKGNQNYHDLAIRLLTHSDQQFENNPTLSWWPVLIILKEVGANSDDLSFVLNLGTRHFHKVIPGDQFNTWHRILTEILTDFLKNATPAEAKQIEGWAQSLKENIRTTRSAEVLAEASKYLDDILQKAQLIQSSQPPLAFPAKGDLSKAIAALSDVKRRNEFAQALNRIISETYAAHSKDPIQFLEALELAIEQWMKATFNIDVKIPTLPKIGATSYGNWGISLFTRDIGHAENFDYSSGNLLHGNVLGIPLFAGREPEMFKSEFNLNIPTGQPYSQFNENQKAMLQKGVLSLAELLSFYQSENNVQIPEGALARNAPLTFDEINKIISIGRKNGKIYTYAPYYTGDIKNMSFTVGSVQGNELEVEFPRDLSKPGSLSAHRPDNPANRIEITDKQQQIDILNNLLFGNGKILVRSADADGGILAAVQDYLNVLKGKETMPDYYQEETDFVYISEWFDSVSLVEYGTQTMMSFAEDLRRQERSAAPDQPVSLTVSAKRLDLMGTTQADLLLPFLNRLGFSINILQTDSFGPMTFLATSRDRRRVKSIVTMLWQKIEKSKLARSEVRTGKKGVTRRTALFAIAGAATGLTMWGVMRSLRPKTSEKTEEPEVKFMSQDENEVALADLMRKTMQYTEEQLIFIFEELGREKEIFNFVAFQIFGASLAKDLNDLWQRKNKEVLEVYLKASQKIDPTGELAKIIEMGLDKKKRERALVTINKFLAPHGIVVTGVERRGNLEGLFYRPRTSQELKSVDGTFFLFAPNSLNLDKDNVTTPDAFHLPGANVNVVDEVLATVNAQNTKEIQNGDLSSLPWTNHPARSRYPKEFRLLDEALFLSLENEGRGLRFFDLTDRIANSLAFNEFTHLHNEINRFTAVNEKKHQEEMSSDLGELSNPNGFPRWTLSRIGHNAWHTTGFTNVFFNWDEFHREKQMTRYVFEAAHTLDVLYAIAFEKGWINEKFIKKLIQNLKEKLARRGTQLSEEKAEGLEKKLKSGPLATVTMEEGKLIHVKAENIGEHLETLALQLLVLGFFKVGDLTTLAQEAYQKKFGRAPPTLKIDLDRAPTPLVSLLQKFRLKFSDSLDRRENFDKIIHSLLIGEDLKNIGRAETHKVPPTAEPRASRPERAMPFFRAEVRIRKNIDGFVNELSDLYKQSPSEFMVNVSKMFSPEKIDKYGIVLSDLENVIKAVGQKYESDEENFRQILKDLINILGSGIGVKPQEILSYAPLQIARNYEKFELELAEANEFFDIINRIVSQYHIPIILADKYYYDGAKAALDKAKTLITSNDVINRNSDFMEYFRMLVQYTIKVILRVSFKHNIKASDKQLVEKGDLFAIGKDHFYIKALKGEEAEIIRVRDGMKFMIKHWAKFGRDPNAVNILLDQDKVSRKHADLYAHRGRWFLEDTNSKNGVVLFTFRRAEVRPIRGLGLSLQLIGWSGLTGEANVFQRYLLQRGIPETLHGIQNLYPSQFPFGIEVESDAFSRRLRRHSPFPETDIQGIDLRIIGNSHWLFPLLEIIHVNRDNHNLVFFLNKYGPYLLGPIALVVPFLVIDKILLAMKSSELGFLPGTRLDRLRYFSFAGSPVGQLVLGVIAQPDGFRRIWHGGRLPEGLSGVKPQFPGRSEARSESNASEPMILPLASLLTGSSLEELSLSSESMQLNIDISTRRGFLQASLATVFLSALPSFGEERKERKLNQKQIVAWKEILKRNGLKQDLIKIVIKRPVDQNRLFLIRELAKALVRDADQVRDDLALYSDAASGISRDFGSSMNRFITNIDEDIRIKIPFLDRMNEDFFSLAGALIEHKVELGAWQPILHMASELSDVKEIQIGDVKLRVINGTRTDGKQTNRAGFRLGKIRVAFVDRNFNRSAAKIYRDVMDGKIKIPEGPLKGYLEASALLFKKDLEGMTVEQIAEKMMRGVADNEVLHAFEIAKGIKQDADHEMRSNYNQLAGSDTPFLEIAQIASMILTGGDYGVQAAKTIDAIYEEAKKRKLIVPQKEAKGTLVDSLKQQGVDGSLPVLADRLSAFALIEKVKRQEVLKMFKEVSKDSVKTSLPALIPNVQMKMPLVNMAVMKFEFGIKSELAKVKSEGVPESLLRKLEQIEFWTSEFMGQTDWVQDGLKRILRPAIEKASREIGSVRSDQDRRKLLQRTAKLLSPRRSEVRDLREIKSFIESSEGLGEVYAAKLYNYLSELESRTQYAFPDEQILPSIYQVLQMLREDLKLDAQLPVYSPRTDVHDIKWQILQVALQFLDPRIVFAVVTTDLQEEVPSRDKIKVLDPLNALKTEIMKIRKGTYADVKLASLWTQEIPIRDIFKSLIFKAIRDQIQRRDQLDEELDFGNLEKLADLKRMVSGNVTSNDVYRLDNMSGVLDKVGLSDVRQQLENFKTKRAAAPVFSTTRDSITADAAAYIQKEAERILDAVNRQALMDLAAVQGPDNDANLASLIEPLKRLYVTRSQINTLTWAFSMINRQAIFPQRFTAQVETTYKERFDENKEWYNSYSLTPDIPMDDQTAEMLRSAVIKIFYGKSGDARGMELIHTIGELFAGFFPEAQAKSEEKRVRSEARSKVNNFDEAQQLIKTAPIVNDADLQKIPVPGALYRGVNGKAAIQNLLDTGTVGPGRMRENNWGDFFTALGYAEGQFDVGDLGMLFEILPTEAQIYEMKFEDYPRKANKPVASTHISRAWLVTTPERQLGTPINERFIEITLPGMSANVTSPEARAEMREMMTQQKKIEAEEIGKEIGQKVADEFLWNLRIGTVPEVIPEEIRDNLSEDLTSLHNAGVSAEAAADSIAAGFTEHVNEILNQERSDLIIMAENEFENAIQNAYAAAIRFLNVQSDEKGLKDWSQRVRKLLSKTSIQIITEEQMENMGAVLNAIKNGKFQETPIIEFPSELLGTNEDEIRDNLGFLLSVKRVQGAFVFRIVVQSRSELRKTLQLAGKLRTRGDGLQEPFQVVPKSELRPDRKTTMYLSRTPLAALQLFIASLASTNPGARGFNAGSTLDGDTIDITEDRFKQIMSAVVVSLIEKTIQNLGLFEENQIIQAQNVATLVGLMALAHLIMTDARTRRAVALAA